jgi:regulator of nucleoside diphosphate kinase
LFQAVRCPNLSLFKKSKILFVMNLSLSVIVSERDARRLRLLVQARRINGTPGESVRHLQSELDRAHIVPDAELPADVIAMDSIVELEDLSSGELMTYALVFPENADLTRGYVSVLAPLGTAMLGYRVGYEFRWPVPGGMLDVRVRKVIGRIAPQPARPSLLGVSMNFSA